MKARTAKLGELVTIVGGGTPSRDRPEYYNGGIPWMTVKDFKGDFFLRNSQEHISTLGLENSASRIVPAGNVILCTRMSVGKAAINLVDIAINQDLKALFCGSELNPRYLTFFLAAVSPRLEAQASGATVKGITIDAVAALDIPLPTLTEQQRIARLLEQADRLRRTRRYALELSDTFLPAAFLELFGEPANKPKWPFIPFGELITAGPQNGLYKPATAYGSGTPIVRIDAYQNGEVIDFAALKRVRLSPEEVETYGLAADDFLINRVNSRSHLGKSTLVPRLSEPTVFESNMMRFRVNEATLVPAYALKFLQTRFLNAQIQKQAKDASNQSSINQTDVECFAILLPPLPLQQQFAALVARHERLRATQREALRQAEHLFQTLLHRAFSEGG